MLRDRLEVKWEDHYYKVFSRTRIEEKLSGAGRHLLRERIREEILHKLSPQLESAYVDSDRQVRDVLEESIPFRSEYPGFLESLEIVHFTFRDKYAEATGKLPLRGEKGLLKNLPLPWATHRYYGLDEAEYIGEAYEKGHAVSEYSANAVPMKYTGLILDARGMELNRAFAPRVYSQSGRLLYGAEFLTKRVAVQRGIVAYVNRMEHPEVKVRAGDHPFYTVPLSSRGKNQTDLVVSDKDAAQAWEHPGTLENLQKCRVVILID